MSLRTVIAGLALIAAAAAPAAAQDVTFTDIRDAVPLRFFSPGTTAPQPGAPNTLVIGFESGTNEFRASAQVGNLAGTRLAMDTLSVVVNAPAGHYVSSIACHLSGRGAVNPPADARATANWVIAGVPANLGSFGGAPFLDGGATWSLSQTTTFTDPGLRVVPVSLTTQLFAFAPDSLASAEVDITSATLVVTVAPITAIASPRE